MMKLVPQVEIGNAHSGVCRLTGCWTALEISDQKKWRTLTSQVAQAKKMRHWDLTGVSQLDTTGAILLARVWKSQIPSSIDVPDEIGSLLREVCSWPNLPSTALKMTLRTRVERLGMGLLGFIGHLNDILQLVGQIVLDSLRVIVRPQLLPLREISAQTFHVGGQALGITALVGFLIGVVLSFLTAQQLKMFGADVFIVNLLGISILRELGPLLAAILVAGRSGSAMTAQIGVMKLTQELDAMKVMGIDPGLRLILPRIIALTIALPLLTVWTNAMALLGGAFAASGQLGLSMIFFFEQLPKVVPIANYWLGIGKAAVFGGTIALIACHYGLRVKPNTLSLGACTTSSVVTSITSVILIDAIFAILFRGVGL